MFPPFSYLNATDRVTRIGGIELYLFVWSGAATFTLYALWLPLLIICQPLFVDRIAINVPLKNPLIQKVWSECARMGYLWVMSLGG